MRVSVAGVAFEIVAEPPLSAADLALLAAGTTSASAEHDPTLRLEVLSRQRQPGAVGAAPDTGSADPAVTTVRGDHVFIEQKEFSVRLDPLARHVRLERATDRAYPLATAIGAAVSMELPFERGLPLHAAGVATERGGIAFFGVSGAGKSTLAATSPHLLLGDEQVLITSNPWQLRRCPLRTPRPGWTRVADAAPLLALVALEKGPAFELERLPASAAYRRLLQAILLPELPALWQRAAAVLRDLVAAIPTYHMAWSPAEPPWPHLHSALG